MAKFSGPQLQSLWLQAGGSNESIRVSTGQTLPLAQVMAAIGLAESREGDPAAINPGVGAGGRKTNEYSVGLWQINTLVHKNYTVQQLKDPLINAKEAVRIYKLQGLRAWGSYTDGRYKRYLSAVGASPSALPAEASVFAQIGTGTVLIGFLVLLLLLDRE